MCSTRVERSVVRGSSTVHDHSIGQNQVRTGGGQFSGWMISGSYVRCGVRSSHITTFTSQPFTQPS